MLAEGVVTWLGNPAVKFIENMNRAFELVVGLVTILVGASIMDKSRVWLVLRTWRCKNDASNHKDYSVSVAYANQPHFS